MANRVQFWISTSDNKERLRLPVNPPEINITSPFGFEDEEVASLGEIQIIKERGLKEVTLSSFFPKYYNTSYCEYTNIPNPQTSIETLEKWRNTRKPLRLTITGTNINMLVTIREFNYTKERYGEREDIYFDMTLKEYKEVAIKKVKDKATTGNKTTTTTRPTTTPAKTTTKNHTVKKNENLSTISKKYYGTMNKWKTIYDANKKKIGSNPNLIYPGMVLVIPNG